MNTFLCEDLRHLPPTTADPHMASESCTRCARREVEENSTTANSSLALLS